MSKVVIIGMGAAGMMAGCLASDAGHEVVLIDGNEKAGKKVFITGKGRCNLTNACETEEFFKAVVTNSRFVNSCYRRFTNSNAIGYFESLGLKTKTERGNRVFPYSDHSSDVIKYLVKRLERNGTTLILNKKVTDVITNETGFEAVRLADGQIIQGERLFIATGGLSYPSTGSTGDGYKFAKKLGHNIIPTCPSLVALDTKEDFPRELMGLSLKNISVTFFAGDKKIYEEQGEMLFTHRGISGPVILSGSAYACDYIRKKVPVKCILDLKPALTEEQLDARLLREFDAAKNRQFKNAFDTLLPKRMTDVMIKLSGIPEERRINSVKREERQAIVKLFKNLTMNITGLGDYNEAVITRGGVDVKEINPKTMESKLCPRVHFIGEVLDIDALTGGFNLQLAWSTAAAAAFAL